MNVQVLQRRQRAFSLMECVVYIALFIFVAGMAFGAFYTMWDQTRAVTANTADIARTMQAGERWRADIRNAVALPQLDDSNTLRLNTKSGIVRYQVRKSELWRESAGREFLVTDRVHASSMQRDQRGNVVAWRWELELKPNRKKSAVRPLFTFTAVPQAETAP
jgi:hypothetical protein